MFGLLLADTVKADIAGQFEIQLNGVSFSTLSWDICCFMVGLLDMPSVTQTATLSNYTDDMKVIQVVKGLFDGNILQ